MKGLFINKDVYYEESDKLVVINYNNTDDIIVLRELESYIWFLLKDHTLEDLIKILESEYEGNNIRKDVEDFINALIEKRVLVRTQDE